MGLSYASEAEMPAGMREAYARIRPGAGKPAPALAVRVPSTKAGLRDAFLTTLRRLAPGLPAPESEVRFAAVAHPALGRSRKWAIDFGWRAHRVGVELEGLGRVEEQDGKRRLARCACGIPLRGRHESMQGLSKDATKYNAAAALYGWIVIRVTSSMLRDEPALVVRMIAAAIAGRTA